MGSAYFNYGQTALTTTIIFSVLVLGYGVPKQWVAIPLTIYCVLWPLFWFRYARSLWLSFDCYFDVTDFDENEESS